ncbi:hypothetical protein ACV3VT_02410 [Legionella pneumophila]
MLHPFMEQSADVSNKILPEWFLTFKVSSLLPDQIKIKVQERIEYIKNLQGKETLLKFDAIDFEIQFFKRLVPLFTSKNIIEVWQDLLRRSCEQTTNFLALLFELEKIYEELAQFKINRMSELKQINKLITKSEDLFSTIQACTNYSDPNLHTVLHLLIKVIDNAHYRHRKVSVELTNDTYFKNVEAPLTRQLKAPNHLPIFFIRKIYVEFLSNYGGPMYGHIHQIVSTIFDASFSENEVIKHCNRINQILSENSIQ